MWNLSSLSMLGIHCRQIKVVWELRIFLFLRGLEGKASGRDAWGGGRREYHYRNSLEEDVSIITETASFFVQRARIHRDLSYIDPQARVLKYFR